MKNMRPALTFITLIFAFLWASPTQAQEITEAGAQRLQSVFQNILANKQTEIAAQKKRPHELILDGNVTVEAVETYYAITLPQMTLSYPDGDRINIGLISLNASPHDKPGQFKTTMALPTAIIGHDETGQEVMRVAIGKQKTSGIWHEKLENFIKLDAIYNDIQITIDGGSASALLPELKIVYDLTENENARWSGPTYVQVSGFIMSSADGVSAAFEQMTLALKLDQFAPEAFKKSATSPSSVATLANGADFNLSVTGLKTSHKNDTGEEESLTLGSGGFNLAYEGALSKTMAARLGFNFKDVKTNNTPQEIAELLPQSGQIKLAQHNIPINSVSEVIENSPKGDAKMLGLSLLLKIPAILAQTGSYIELYETTMQNENYLIDLETTLRADIAAANSATANGKLRFRGLDKVLSLAQVAGRSLGGSEYVPSLRAFARLLERLKPLGRVETDAESGFIHVFDLEMNKAGQFLINNQNAALLFNEP